MRRPTKRNLAALLTAADSARDTGLPYSADLYDLYSRLTEATETVTERGGLPAAAVEKILATSGKLTVARDASSGWWAAQGIRCKRLVITSDHAEQMARWLRRQEWLSPGLMLDTVLKRWESWMVRAQSEVVPDAAANTLKDIG